MKYIYKFQKFMNNRYGIDELYKFMICLYFILIIINLFIRTKILSVIELLIFLIIIYRFLSKNKQRRSKENTFYLKIKSIITKPIKILKRNYKDRKDYVYKKCHKCKTTLRLPLPYSRGIKHTKCPKCGKRLSLIVLRREKIEIIKNNI